MFALILISSRPLSRRGTKKFQMRDSSRSRDNSKTRIDSKDTAQATIECLDKNSKNNKMIIEKDEVVQLPKKQSSADINTNITAEASSENKKVHQNGQHIPPPPNEQNSVKLNNEIPKESKNATTDEGISYNVTGKLKTLGDMIINETKPIKESVGKYYIALLLLLIPAPQFVQCYVLVIKRRDYIPSYLSKIIFFQLKILMRMRRTMN